MSKAHHAGNVAVCIPVCDPGPDFGRVIEAIRAQTARIDSVLIVDSSTEPQERYADPPFRTLRIAAGAFDHGGTRRMAVDALEDADIVVFLTQDAMPAEPTAIERLLACFDDPRVGAAYGRQLPRGGAGEMERHARLFNYPAQTRIKTADDIPHLGLKAAFICNPFAAWRREALRQIGGFPERSIVSEDTYVAARMLVRGWKVAYCAEATVFHSHTYTLRQEFQRYFDIGVFHARQPWIRESFSGAEKEGWRFVLSELEHLLRHDPLRVPVALARTPVRYCGFRAGLLESRLPLSLKACWSMQKRFWAAERVIRAGREGAPHPAPSGEV